MKQAMRKLLAMALAAVMVFSVMAPGMTVSATPAGDDRVTETTLPEQTWQMNQGFPKGTDDTLAINSIHSFDGYRDQGEIYVTLDARVESFRLFVNNVEIGTAGMEGGKTYVVDIADIAVDGINSVQVSNIYPVGINKLVTVRAGYPSVIEGIPEDVGLDSSTLEALSDMLENEVKYGFSGAQVAIVKDGKLVYSEAFGAVNGWNADGTQIQEGDEGYAPVTTETLYDLASNSKMYTANYAVQYLYEQGKLDINATIESLFPGFVENTVWIDYDYTYTGAADLEECKQWKSQLTVKDILMHQAGFAADPQFHNNYYDQATQANTANPEQNVLYSQDRDLTLEMILKSPLVYEPGTNTVYSDVDYMLLCFVVEKVTGQRMDEYLKEVFWDPMGLENMTFNPLENGWTVDQIAATELDGNKRADFEDLATGGEGVIKFDNMRDGPCQGTVHDEKAYYAMDGISGHAGLFSNAEDLAKLASVMLTGGYGDNHYFKDSTIEMFTEAKSLDYTTWGLGWWREGELGRDSYWTAQASNDTIGHQGWTGTLTMIDPEEDLVTVILGNRKNSPVLANEQSSNDFYGDNMVMGTIGIVNEYVYEALRSTPDAVDTSIYEMALQRIRALSGHTDAYDEVAHMNDAFALTDNVIVRAEKRQTAETLAYAKEVVDTLRSEVALYVTGTYGIANANNLTNAAAWLAEFDARIAGIEVTTETEAPVMTAVQVDDAPGINAETLAYDGTESADQNAVFFPRVRSTGNATSYAHRNHMTWWDTFEGQGTMYVAVQKPVSALRIFLNGHEVDTSNMINTTGIFAIDASEYTINGRNLIQMSDMGYSTGRSVLLVVHNAEVIEGEAADVGIDEAVFGTIDAIVANDVEYGFTSAQLAVVKDGKLVHTNAWGAANSYHSDGTRINEGDEDYVAVTDETLYDLASNSKMYSVNYALQKLVSDGKVKLTDKIVDIFPEFVTSTIYKKGTTATQAKQIDAWKAALTIRDILEHQAGFDPDPQYHNDQFDQITQLPAPGVDNELFSQERETTLKMVLASPLTYEPGTKTVYSDVDYMLLCFVIEKITGMGIQEYLTETFWEPMGLTSITYNPLDNGFTKDQVAATELNGNSRDGVISFVNIRDGVIQGTVHDEKCYYAMGGISGHAGLFANATTLATLAQVMQNYNGYGTTRLANSEVNTVFTDRKDALSQWGLGWWREGDYQRPWYFGAQSPSGTVGHQGWTGTLSSIDTVNNLTTVYLTNKINSPVTDNKSNANKFDGNWYTASSLGFVPTILYMGMEEFNAADDIQPALDALLIDMAVIKMNRVVGNGTVDITHPNLLSAYSIMEAAVEAVVERPTEENLDSLKIAFASMSRKYTAEELADLYAMVDAYVNPFSDVEEGRFWYAPALWAAMNGITHGAEDGIFDPEGELERAQVVTMLWRAAGEPEPETTVNPFTDVTEGTFYYKAVLWATENGITKGMTKTTFEPKTVASRAQTVTFLWRANGKAEATVENPFDDVKANTFYYNAVLWAVENGITEGVTPTHFGTTMPCNRAHAVTFLSRVK